MVGPNLPKNLLDLDNSVEMNINILAEAKKKKNSELKACVLKRPRHNHIVDELTKMNVDSDIVHISKREVELYPFPPPGSHQIVTER